MNKMPQKMMVLLSCGLMAASVAHAGGAGAPPKAAKPAACKTIAQLVSADPQLSTLNTAVGAAGLGATLSGGQYTVFAPTNAAFNKVPSDTLSSVLNDPEMLRAVLSYHVLPGKVSAKQIMNLRSVKTVQGSTLSIKMMGSKVMVNGVNVIRADVPACNGVVHLIDTVLMPPMGAKAPVSPAPATAAAPAPAMIAAAMPMVIPVTPASMPAATPAADTTVTPAPAPVDTISTAVAPAPATTETTVTTTTTTTDTTTADASATMSDNTIYDVIVGDDRFSTLRSLLSDADLTETLMTGDYTLFAPTDDAFAKLSPDTLAVIASDPELLKKVLLYHVVNGKLGSDQVSGALTSMEGQPLNVSRDSSAVKIGDASVTTTAVGIPSNGVVYAIDTVLLPSDVTIAAPPVADTAPVTTVTTTTVSTPAPAAAPAALPAATMSIAQMVSSDPRFSTLNDLIGKAGLADTLNTGTHTVFAPTNDAFSKISKTDLDALVADPARLRAVLLNHVVDGNVTVNTATATTTLTPLGNSPQSLQLRVDSGAFKIGNATIVEPNIAATNGTIQVIDTVLLPPR